MDILQGALVVLVIVWTLIFIMIGAAVFMIFLMVRKAINKVNKILDTTEEIAESARIPSKIVIASVLGFLAKNSAEGIKNIISTTIGNKFGSPKKSSKK